MYKPDKKGILSSIMMSLGFIPNAIYMLIGEKIVNPDSTPLKVGQRYYGLDISQNVKKYYLLMFFTLPIGTFLALLFTYQYKHEEHSNSNSKEQLIFNKKQLNIDNEKTKSELKQVFKSKRLRLLVAINFLSSFIIFLNLNTFKTIGTLNQMSVSALAVVGAFAGFSSVGLGPLWGFLADKVSFTKLILFINSIGVFTGICLGFTLKYKLCKCFSALICLNVLCASGFRNVMNPHMMKVFTIEYSMRLGGIVGIASAMSNIIGSALSFVFSKVYGDSTDQNKAFFILYGVGGMFSFIALVLGLFENDEPFEFSGDFIKEKDARNEVNKISTLQVELEQKREFV